MKKLVIFILLIVIGTGIFHLVRVHDQAIPLAEKQTSFLTATHYSSQRNLEITASPEEETLQEKINSLRASKELPPLEWDESAHLLAIHHSALMRKQDQPDFDLSGYAPLESRTKNMGISDVCFYSLYADRNISQILKQMEKEEDPLYTKDSLTHIGIGMVHQLFPWRYWVTIVYIKRIAFLDEFPIQVPEACSRETLRWRLRENYSTPQVKMTTRAGEVEELTVKTFSKGRYESEILFWKPGNYTLEILALGPYGVEVAQIMPVYVQIPREKELVERITYSKDAKVEVLEKAMFELINRDRAEYKVKSLQFNPSLCSVARIHSRNMVKSDKVAHELPGGPVLSERLQNARLKVLKHGENIASDLTIEDAQVNLMKSPGHRQTMLDPDYTHVGVGIVKHKNKNMLYVTQNFASFIPEVSPAEGRRILLRKINQFRSSPLRENPTLTSIAQKHSESMATSGKLLTKDNLKDKLTSREVKFKQVSFQTISALLTEQIVEELKKSQNIRSDSMREIGIGLRQSNDGLLWVTIIVKQ